MTVLDPVGNFLALARRQGRRATLAILAAVAFLLVACFVTIHGGAVHIAPLDALNMLAARIGLVEAAPASEALATILIDIRLPRIALGILTGAGLAVSGVTLQGLFRNPLADPGLVGVSTGAALAAAAFIVLGHALAAYLPAELLRHALPLAAFLGGLVATIVVYAVATRDGRTEVATLLLAGVAINAMAAAGIGLLIFISSEQELRSLNFWMLGSLNGVTWERLAFAAPLMLLPTVILMQFSRHLNALLLGETEARHLGFQVERMKRVMVGLVALNVGAVVALTGAIGFVGLVVPHLVRLMIGADHRTLFPLAALLGAALVLLADLVARTIVVPAELPIGILTALIGGPFFLWLLLRQRDQGGLVMLSASDIRVVRGQRRIVDDVSLRVADGEMVAVIGPNGAGKTTLLHAISGALQPDGGAVEIGGRALGAWKTRDLARRRAVLTQNATLGFPFTALQVVMIGRSPHMGRHPGRGDLRAAAAAMTETGVLHLAERSYPTLSGGEKQRVQLARVLAQIADEEAGAASASRYLLLDEPTNNLDLAHQHLVLGAARRLADRGVAVLAVLHDPNHAAAYADRIHVLCQGRTFAAGTPHEVLTTQLMGAVFGVSARVMNEPGRDRPYVLVWPQAAPTH